MKKEVSYEERIDRSTTAKVMKQQMLFLKHYVASLRFHSVLYGEETQHLQVEDELVDYLHYSKSVIQAQRKKSYQEKEDAIVEAMMRQQKDQAYLAERDEHAYLLLQGIAQLENQDREALLNVYVRQIPMQTILLRQGIVESTYHRHLQRAYVHLAIILHKEVLQI